MSEQHAPKGTVALAVASKSGVHPHTTRTLLEVVVYDLIHGGGHLNRHRPAFWNVGSGFVTSARNVIVQHFLRHDGEGEPDWLLFLDDDQLYPPHLLDLLMVSADPVERPIVGLPVWRFIDANNNGVRITHNVYTADPDGALREWDEPFPPNTVMSVAAVGTGCMMVHRSALLRMREAAVLNGMGPTFCWFRQTVQAVANDAGELISDHVEGEDLHFCRLAAVAGLRVCINTSETLQHAKTTMLQAASPPGAFSLMGEFAASAPRLVDPATDPTAVLVPVLNRPQNAEPFMRSLRASTGLATVYALCSEDDDAKAWDAAGARVVGTEGVTFAEKVNEGYPWTNEPWVLLVGDDVRFHPGWLDHAQAVARETGAKVIGTNDLGNPRVMAGEHATHMLIARDYIDEQGASWDGPGVICHEGYRHWFVDDEIVTAARQRGVFRPALASLVEHLHPIWHKAPDDDTYRLGQRHAEQDQRTHLKRLKRSQEMTAA